MKKSFSIIELLIFMVIFSSIIVLLSEILSSALNLKLESEAVSSVEMDGRFILARLMHDITRSQSVSTPAASGGTGNTLTLSISGVSNTYSLSGSNLVLNDGSDNNVNGFNTSLTSFTVTHLGPGLSDSYYKDSVKVNFTIRSRVIKASGTESKTFQTTVALR